MRRRTKKRLLIFTIFIIIVGLVSVTSYKFWKNNNKKPVDVKEPVIEKPVKPKEPQVDKLSFLATGDALIHSGIYEFYRQKDGSYDFTNSLALVKDIVPKYDIAYYNQETVFGGKEFGYSNFPMFNTPSEFGDAMLNIGFNTVSIASNHSFDKGEKGALNNIKYFKEKNVLYNGMAENETDRTTYIIKEKNNIKYSMLSYTMSTNGLNTPKGKEYLVNVFDKEKARKDIEALKKEVDVLMVAMHWGNEYASMPNNTQKEVAQFLADLGVNIIIGSHPHVLQPITWIGDTLVIYSLGNFISNQYTTDNYNKKVGLFATLDITKTTTEAGSTIKLSNLGGELLFSYYKKNSGNLPNTAHQVIPFSKMTDDTYLKDYPKYYDMYTKILKTYTTDINIAPL
ncbi:MAG: CapA family protein, partial [Bacilli bacterium]